MAGTRRAKSRKMRCHQGRRSARASSSWWVTMVWRAMLSTGRTTARIESATARTPKRIADQVIREKGQVAAREERIANGESGMEEREEKVRKERVRAIRAAAPWPNGQPSARASRPNNSPCHRYNPTTWARVVPRLRSTTVSLR